MCRVRASRRHLCAVFIRVRALYAPNSSAYGPQSVPATLLGKSPLLALLRIQEFSQCVASRVFDYVLRRHNANEQRRNNCRAMEACTTYFRADPK